MKNKEGHPLMNRSDWPTNLELLFRLFEFPTGILGIKVKEKKGKTIPVRGRGGL
jgi:hypothetical protein